MGVSLAVHSAIAANARAKVGHAASAVRVHVRVVAPWYIAMDDGHGAGTRASLETPPRMTSSVAHSKRG